VSQVSQPTRPAELSPRVLEWRSGGELVALGDDRVFARRSEGRGPLLLFLHGFPSSSYDWRETIAALTGRATLALDFLGFGLSDKPARGNYSLLAQADRVESLVADDSRPVVLVAHDMGTSVATELLARDIDGALRFELQAVLLFNGSIIIERASLTWAQRALRSPLGGVIARMSNRRAFQRQFGHLFSPGHPLSREEAEDQWALWRRAGGAHLAHRLIVYLTERTTFAPRWHGAIRDWPGRLDAAWGLRDPVATPNVLEGLRLLRPSMPVTELPSLGHYPQIEEPGTMAGLIDALASGDGG
jgi:pimeloyl-ACP methyl ester carboxylesterase